MDSGGARGAGAVMLPPRRRWRLVPEDDHLGWTPYIWLVYLAFFLAEPVARLRVGTASAGYVAAIVVGLLVFLVTYFRGFWASGRELVGLIAIQSLIGMALAPLALGASVFFIYAASFAGMLDHSRQAARAIVVVAVLALVTYWAVDAPVRYMLPALGMPLIIGFVNLHAAEGRRTNARLRIAQDRIEQLAAVAERERIARDLHDVLGHTLSLIVLKSELATKLATRDGTRAAQEMREVEAVSRSALRDVRDAIRGYRASLREELARSRTLLEAAAIRAHVDSLPLGWPLLARPEEEALALALREAVTNVVRHADATSCEVRLVMHEGELALRVTDDGRGIDMPEGGGLRGMRERVEAMGGHVARVAGPRGRGTWLEVRLRASPDRLDRHADGDAAGHGGVGA